MSGRLRTTACLCRYMCIVLYFVNYASNDLKWLFYCRYYSMYFFPPWFVCFLQRPFLLFSLLSGLLDVNLLDRRSSITMRRSGCSLTVATRTNTDCPTRERETDICWFLNMHWCISSCHRKAVPPGNNKSEIGEGGGRCIFFIEQLCGCVYNLKGNKAYCVADCSLLGFNWR